MAAISSTPDVLDITLYRGDTVSLKVSVKDGAAAAVNLTGWSAKATIYNLVGVAVNTGFTVGTPNSSGDIFLFLPDGTSEALLTGFTYDLEIWRDTAVTDLPGSPTKAQVITVLKGTFTVTNDITDGTGGGRGAIT